MGISMTRDERACVLSERVQCDCAMWTGGIGFWVVCAFSFVFFSLFFVFFVAVHTCAISRSRERNFLLFIGLREPTRNPW